MVRNIYITATSQNEGKTAREGLLERVKTAYDRVAEGFGIRESVPRP
jgi:hypothetical protein